MDPITITTPSREPREEEIDAGAALRLTLTDDEIAAQLSDRVDRSERSWNAELDLKERRMYSERAYLNDIKDEDELYDWQMGYKNNRLLTGIETILSLLMQNVPEPIITPGSDTRASRELADNLRVALLAQYEDLFLKAKFTMVGRHILTGQRIAYMKYVWDGTLGRVNEDGERTGAISVSVIRPSRIVIEEKTQWEQVDDIPLIAEFKTATVEELCLRFPDKQNKLYEKFGIKKGEEKTNLGKKVGHVENWFSYYDGEGNKQEALVWKYNDLVLDKYKNPNYDYDEYDKDEEGNLVYLNFFDRPKKPYIAFNHLNLGRFLIDDTSLIEQAIPLQKVLNKRGRQIVENADMANAGLIFNEEQVNEENAAKLIGDPDERLLVKGDVRAAASRLPMNLLPNYVVEDKIDARNEIDNILGTNAPLRGEKSSAKTLGQEVISQRSNMSRLQTLSDSLEDGGMRLYQGIVQMMKVYWDEETMVKYTGRDGYTTFMEFDKDKIEDGVGVRVRAGSLMPKDDAAMRAETLQIADALDPLSLMEGLGRDNPREIATRMVYYKLMPDKYFTEVLDIGDGVADPDALNDIQLVNNGTPIPVRDDITTEYLTTYQNFVEGPSFKTLPPEIQAAHIEFFKATTDKAKIGLKQDVAQEEPADTSSALSPGGEAGAPPAGQPAPPEAGGEFVSNLLSVPQ